MKSLLSGKAHAELYRLSRGDGIESVGVRSRLTFNICLVLALFLFSFLIALSVRNQSTERYLASRPDMTVFNEETMSVRVTEPVEIVCKNVEECYQELRRQDKFTDYLIGIEKPPYARHYEKIQPKGASRYMLARIKLEMVGTRLPVDADDLIVQLPRMRYERAHVFVQDAKQTSFLAGDPVFVQINSAKYRGLTFSPIVLLELKEGQDERPIRWSEPAFATPHPEFKRYQQFQEERRTNPAYQIATVARVVLALFALILFLIVESSPEALGLALFMGFEGIALTTSVGDLRRNWLPEGIDITGFIHYCNAMGDIFRLYFFLQLCRVIKPQPKQWLGWGSVYAVIYGALRHFDPITAFPQWATHHVVQRDMIVAMLGFIFCARTAVHLYGKNLPWRVAALSLGTFASLAQWLGAAPFYLPFLNQLGELIGSYGALITVVNANSAYLFALCTFLNISTLENRVRVLSQEKARAEAIERELELGRQVQQAFLDTPDLPPEIRMAYHHEAAVYVSGDTYFVHWSPDGRTLTFLLNDVTGHGIQAALKAFACNIIARSVWGLGQAHARGERRAQDARLSRYDQEVVELICRGAMVGTDGGERVPDFNAMVGVEFNLEARRLKLYRVNYNFPLLIVPSFDFAAATSGREVASGGWCARQLSIPNQVAQELPLVEGAFVLLISDGFIETARDQRDFATHMNAVLKAEGAELDPERVKALALSWRRIKARKIVDDRTMLVFQWHPYAAEMAMPKAS